MADALGPQHHNIVEIFILPLYGLTSVEEVRNLHFVLILKLSFRHKHVNQFYTLHPAVFFAHCVDSYDEIFELEFHLEGVFKGLLNVLFA